MPGGEARGADRQVGGIRADQPRHHDRERQRGRIAARGPPGPLAHGAPLGALLRGREHGVVLVGELRGEPDGAGLRAAADDERRVRALHRLGQGIDRHQPVVLALEGERAVGPGSAHDGELLLEHVHARPDRREAEAVGLVLALVPAGSEAELDAAIRDVVDRRHVLGEHGRVPERRGRDEHAQPELRRHRRQARHRHPRVERAALLVAVDREVVVGAEQRAHAVLLAGLREGHPLRPGHVLLAFDHQLDPHGCSSLSLRAVWPPPGSPSVRDMTLAHDLGRVEVVDAARRARRKRAAPRRRRAPGGPDGGRAARGRRGRARARSRRAR